MTEINSILNNQKTSTDGFVSLAQLGIELGKKGITCESLHVKRLADYFYMHPNEYELAASNTIVRLRTNTCETIKTDSEHHYPIPLDLSEIRINWQDVGKRLVKLERIQEDWGEHYIGLIHFIKAQYIASVRENTIVQRAHTACFHSGLYDSLFNPLYMVLDYNETEGGWRFQNIITKGSSPAKYLYQELGRFPERPSYGNPEDFVINLKDFDPHASIDWTHILRRASRMPEEFLRENTPFSFNPSIYTSEDDFNDEFYQAIQADPRTYAKVTDLLRGAVLRGLALAEESPNEVVIGYNYRQGEVIFLLPLKVSDNNDPADMALVITRRNGELVAPTIYTIPWCYESARVRGRIHTSWL